MATLAIQIEKCRIGSIRSRLTLCLVTLLSAALLLSGCTDARLQSVNFSVSSVSLSPAGQSQIGVGSSADYVATVQIQRLTNIGDVGVNVFLVREPNVAWTVGDRDLSMSQLTIKAGQTVGSTPLILQCRQDHHIVGTLTTFDGSPNDPDSQVGFADVFGTHWANIHATANEADSDTIMVSCNPP